MRQLLYKAAGTIIPSPPSLFTGPACVCVVAGEGFVKSETMDDPPSCRFWFGDGSAHILPCSEHRSRPPEDFPGWAKIGPSAPLCFHSLHVPFVTALGTYVVTPTSAPTLDSELLGEGSMSNSLLYPPGTA